MYRGLIPSSLLHAIPEENESVRGSRISIAALPHGATGERDGGASVAAAAALAAARLRHKGSDLSLREDPVDGGGGGSVPLARLRNRPGSELGEWHRMSAPAMVLVAAEAITKEGPPAPNARLLDADTDAAQRLFIQVREYLNVELNAFSVCLRLRKCTIFAYFVYDFVYRAEAKPRRGKRWSSRRPKMPLPLNAMGPLPLPLNASPCRR